MVSLSVGLLVLILGVCLVPFLRRLWENHYSDDVVHRLQKRKVENEALLKALEKRRADQVDLDIVRSTIEDIQFEIEHFSQVV